MVESIIQGFDIWTDAKGLKSKGRVKSVENISLEGIARLRELILELAVRGKLVPQNSKDEPASVLLDKIDLEKVRLVKEGKIKKQEKLPKIGEEEKPFILPESWEWVYLSEITQIIGGGTPKSTEKDNWTDEGISWLTPADLYEFKGKYISKGRRDISKKGLRSSSATLLPAGTVLFSSRAPIGYVAIAANDLSTNQGFKSCVPYQDGMCEYLFFYLKHAAKEIDSKASGTTFKEISGAGMAKVYVTLPPLAEQHRIVAKVDELMTLCDTLEEKQSNNLKTHQLSVITLLETLTQATDTNELQSAWERMASHFDSMFCTEDSIDQLKKTILHLALKGKLLPQNPTDESASELFKKIAEIKERLLREGKIKNQERLSGIGESEKPFKLPEGWVWERLNNVIDVRDGTHDSPKDAFGSNTYPLVTSKNFKDGIIDFEGARRISEEDHKEISKRSLVEKFDILFSMIGGNLGNQVMVNDDRPFSVKNVALFKYYDKKLISPYFIKKFTEYLALDLQNSASGGAQPFVSLGFLRNIIIAIPPINEQHRIVAKVDELFSICEALKSKIVMAEEIRVQLAEAVVESATA